MSAYEMPTDVADPGCCCAGPAAEDTSAPLIEEPVIAEPVAPEPLIEPDPVDVAPEPVLAAPQSVVEAPAPVVEAPTPPEPNFGVTQIGVTQIGQPEITPDPVANTTQPSPEPALVQNTAVVEGYVPPEFSQLGTAQPQSSAVVENPTPAAFTGLNRQEYASPGDRTSSFALHGEDVWTAALSSQSPRAATLESTYTYGQPLIALGTVTTVGLNSSITGPSSQRATYNSSTGTSWED